MPATGPSRLAGKLTHYAGELMFVARAAGGAGDGLRLAGRGIDYHLRNWRKAAIDPRERMSVRLRLCGRVLPVTLRPRDSDLGILFEVFARGPYHLPASLLPPADVLTIVDAGANVGLSALDFADRYPQARIFAIEPNPDNFALLRANTAAIGRIVPVAAALTADRGGDVYVATAGRASHFKTNGEGRGVAVRGLTLAEIMAGHGIDRIDLLKIDVEGAEAAIFGRGDFLARTGMVVAELHGAYGLDQFNADVARHGLRARPSPYTREPGIVLAERPSPGRRPD